MSSTELSIVIVSYNTQDVLRRCLAAVFEFTKGLGFEVIVVDNASIDGSVEMIRAEFPSVRLIQNNTNMGFAAGQNRGIEAATGACILILNSDVILLENTAATLLEYLNEAGSEVGVIGPRVINADGSLAPSARRLRLSNLMLTLSVANRHFHFSQCIPQRLLRTSRLPLLSRVHDNFWPHDEVRVVEAVDGMCCLIRRAVLEDVGLFDEQFFFDFEILDLSHRIRSCGRRIVYCPWTAVMHLGHSSRTKVRRILIETTRSELYYYAKHYSRQFAFLKRLTVAVIAARLAAHRIAMAIHPNPDRAGTSGILRECLTVARTFRPSTVRRERIPVLQHPVNSIGGALNSGRPQ